MHEDGQFNYSEGPFSSPINVNGPGPVSRKRQRTEEYWAADCNRGHLDIPGPLAFCIGPKEHGVSKPTMDAIDLNTPPGGVGARDNGADETRSPQTQEDAAEEETYGEQQDVQFIDKEIAETINMGIEVGVNFDNALDMVRQTIEGPGKG
ncbi:hypothetical protein R6Q59_023194 [Mikania micrantha]